MIKSDSFIGDAINSGTFQKGVIQSSMYDTDAKRIRELVNLGVPINKISNLHLRYGTAKSLGKYVKK